MVKETQEEQRFEELRSRFTTEEWDEFTNQVLCFALPNMLREMLNRGLIDPTRILDTEYLVSTVRSDLGQEEQGVLAQMKVSWQMHDGFITVAEYALAHEQSYAAVVLLATAVEHILNLYYGERLSMQGFSPKDVTQIVRSLNMDAKMGWLTPLTGQFEFPEDLKRHITRLVELRNSIVHYKEIPTKLDDEDNYTQIMRAVDGIDFDEVLADIEKLESLLESELDKADPNRSLAKEIAHRMLMAERKQE